MNNTTAVGMQGLADMQADASASSAVCRQMPLSFLSDGETACIAKVRGRGDLHHHLENLGFVEGASVKVLSQASGDLIVEVKGTQIALNRQIAARIITKSAA